MEMILKKERNLSVASFIAMLPVQSEVKASQVQLIAIFQKFRVVQNANVSSLTSVDHVQYF